MRALTLFVAIAGALCSLVFLFQASAHPPVILMVLFIGWVSSPFAGLAVSEFVSSRWSAAARRTLRALTLIVTLISLVAYSGVVPMPVGTKPAALFLMVPLASWAMMLVAVIWRSVSRKS